MKRVIAFVGILVFSLFLYGSYCFADEIGGVLNNNVSQKSKTDKIINGNNNDETDIPKTSNEDIFGDEQAFPFIAGLGKNAAH